ncbi:MAG TPA: TIR domain-containing protein [Lacunisphaera sp.]
MSDAPRAIFLSYAREDAEAARHIADALRAFGVVVWFDQAELRGGEAWDANIRKQIRECALFIAIVSATTQARGEGYFRREWRLAVERMQDMAAGLPFLLPVVIDDTPEKGALVPDEFMRVHWTRMPKGIPSPQFVDQVKKLLVERSWKATQAPAGSPAPAVSGKPVKPAGRPGWLWAVLGVVAAAVIGGFLVLRPAAASAPAAAPKPAPAPAAAPARLADKSIAVLPFTNMSEDKDSGYFADGVHEDVLTNLALVRELRVVSRTSVQAYRGTTKSMKQIAEELGVTYILEGSVRRSGNKVRVTGQLIHAATDEHVWAQSYDRDLTDIFAIQAELAQQIAKALSAALSPEEKARLEHPLVANPAAYDLVLKARQIDQNGNDTRQELETEEAMLQSAVTLDPGYAAAWANLGALHSQMIFNNVDASDARLAKAQAAIDTAKRLDPENFDVILGTGTFYYYGLRDYARALQEVGRITRQWPNNPFGHFVTALILRRQGKWLESLASLQRAKELDPGSAEHARNLAVSYVAMRRYADALAEQERRVRLLPESLRESFELARLKYYLNGSTKEGDDLLAGPIAAHADPVVAAGYRKLWAAMKGDYATALRISRDFPDAWAPAFAAGGGSPAEYAWNNAVVLAATGDLAGARRQVEKYPAELRARLVNEPRNSTVLVHLAYIESLLGHPAEALAAARQAREILPETLDPITGRQPHQALAMVLAWQGDKAAAIAELKQLLATGGQPNVYWLKNGPWFAPLKGDPAFEALLNDPKNNAPLF